MKDGGTVTSPRSRTHLLLPLFVRKKMSPCQQSQYIPHVLKEGAAEACVQIPPSFFLSLQFLYFIAFNFTSPYYVYTGQRIHAYISFTTNEINTCPHNSMYHITVQIICIRASRLTDSVSRAVIGCPRDGASAGFCADGIHATARWRLDARTLFKNC